MSAKPKQDKAPTVDIGTLCRLFNLTAARIGQLAKDGVVVKSEKNRYDLWQSIKNYIRFLQESRRHATGTSDDHGASYSEHRARLTKAKADKEEVEAEKAKGSVVDLRTVGDTFAAIGAVTKAAIMRFEADIPPMVCGLSEAQAQVVIRKQVDEVLTVLSDETNRFWSDYPSKR